MSYGLYNFGEFFKMLFCVYTIAVIVLNVLAVYLPNKLVYPKLMSYDGTERSAEECGAFANKYSSVNIALTLALIFLYSVAIIMLH